MKQNPDRMWFDKGYRRGQRDVKKEAFWPKILGISFILILAWVSFVFAVAVFFCYFLLEYSLYRDRNKGKDIEPPPFIKE
jgi:hypothetical protein